MSLFGTSKYRTMSSMTSALIPVRMASIFAAVGVSFVTNLVNGELGRRMTSETGGQLRNSLGRISAS
jgi:hypothetical protein